MKTTITLLALATIVILQVTGVISLNWLLFVILLILSPFIIGGLGMIFTILTAVSAFVVTLLAVMGITFLVDREQNKKKKV